MSIPFYADQISLTLDDEMLIIQQIMEFSDRHDAKHYHYRIKKEPPAAIQFEVTAANGELPETIVINTQRHSLIFEHLLGVTAVITINGHYPNGKGCYYWNEINRHKWKKIDDVGEEKG